ncbi:MAG: hypothetical protein AAGD01_08495 [Acidobacteriota bacterium]
MGVVVEESEEDEDEEGRRDEGFGAWGVKAGVVGRFEGVRKEEEKALGGPAAALEELSKEGA